MGYQKRGTFYPRTFPPRSVPETSERGLQSALTWNTDLIEQNRMLEESERMILDTNKRLGAAVQELRELIVGFLSSPPFSFPS